MQKKCNFMSRARSFAALEVGCPLDHCACNTHDVDHECYEHDDHDDDVREAERNAGWDPNP